jgi:hypothetical protein
MELPSIIENTAIRGVKMNPVTDEDRQAYQMFHTNGHVAETPQPGLSVRDSFGIGYVVVKSLEAPPKKCAHGLGSCANDGPDCGPSFV